MKVCPACKAKLAGDDSVCPRCGRVVESFPTRVFPVVEKKKRIYPCSVYLTERRLVISPGDDPSYDYMGLAGGIASVVAVKVKADRPELDSPWEQIVGLRVTEEKVGSALNSIAAGCGILITYASGAQVVLGVNRDHAQRIAELMESLRNGVPAHHY